MKRFLSIILLLFMLFSVVSCVDTTTTEISSSEENQTNESQEPTDPPVEAHKHVWAEATCTQPKTCECGVTEGNALGHDWDTYVCGSSAACQREGCDETIDEIPHTWVNATLTAPKYCSSCQEIVMQYDDYFPSLLSIPATKDSVDVTGKLEIKTVDDVKYFHAKGVGEATLTDGDKSYTVTVEKAKINIIVVMGQSNSVDWQDSVSGSNLFLEAETDIAPLLGTTYVFNNNTKNPKATLYTDTSRGIHSTLLAELYAQSVAAGNPTKNVLVWKNEATSKSGMSISYWATPDGVLTPTLHTEAYYKKCLETFTKKSTLYEVESSGVYWLQGEIDGSTNAHLAIPGHEAMNPATYEASFMTMWNYLEAAGLEYVAFLRVRRDVEDNKFPNAENPDHNDLTYTTALSAQLKMIAENDNFYLATTLTENWVGTADTEYTIDITKYASLMSEYENGEEILDRLGTNVIATVSDGELTTTMEYIYGSIAYCHYGKFGYTLIAADAAYNMYRALYGNSFAIVQGDTSGSPSTQITANAGDTQTIDVSAMTEDIVFRANEGSIAGTLSIQVMSGEAEITEAITITEGAHLGALNTELLKTYENVTITVTYTPINGEAGSVIYTIA